MSSNCTILTEDAWPFDPATERDLLLQRMCDRDQLQEIGETHAGEWFAEQTVTYSNAEEARNRLVECLDEPTAMEAALETAGSDAGWFYGWHYVVEVDGSPVVSRGPAHEQWSEIAAELRTQTAGNDRLTAFLRGILAHADDDTGATVRVGFGEAEAMGNRYYENGRLAANTVATEPGLLTGIRTRKGANSGRTYRVARELVPVFLAALDHQADREAEPGEASDHEEGAGTTRRVPTFEDVLDGVTVKPEDIERFEQILTDHEALAYWAEYIAPTVQFRRRAKKAMLCMLASPNDAHGTKGRTNALIFGPPSTGKSAFKEFLVDEFGAYSIDGARVSQADLTYNKATDEDGLLVRAHKGLAVIEEADEMADDALRAALTALGESGRIEIRDLRLPAEVRGVLIGNYRSRDEIVSKHSAALFDRFEFVLEFERLAAEKRDAALDRQYEYFRQPTDPSETEDLKKYLAWVRDFDPTIPTTELSRIETYKRDRINEIDTIREGVAILNVAYTIARLNHRNMSVQDYKQAFELVT